MSAHALIIDHDKWRRGTGGAPAGVSGSDGDAYAGLDLNFITFTGGSFNGSSFASTSFKEADWSSCHFIGVSFNDCDLGSISISACRFTSCTFTGCRFQSGSITTSPDRMRCAVRIASGDRRLARAIRGARLALRAGKFTSQAVTSGT